MSHTKAPAHLTVMSWNVDGWHTIRDEQVALIDGTGADLALLQEVTSASADVLREAGWEIVTALEILPEGHVERAGRRPRFSCAVAVRGDLRIVSTAVLKDAPSPVRTLVARIAGPTGPFVAMSAALPPGSMWGRAAKQGQARVIGTHLEGLHHDGVPVIVGMDRNGPKHERFDPAATEWWPEDEPALFADDAPHGLRDVLVTLHAEQPERRAAASTARPDGPLEVSYAEQRTDPPSLRRYDVILASSNWHVRDVTYDYAASVRAGSDHSSVTADLCSADTGALPTTGLAPDVG
jgi:endonuclease/exonuclease/phosphatase family metal-dependent hydrolase